MTHAQEIAQTILEQLGGSGRLKLMINAKNFVAHSAEKENSFSGGLSFQISCKGSKCNYVKVMLHANDTYTVEFGKMRSIAYFLKHNELLTVTHTQKGVYCDMLVDLVEEHTGLYLTLARRK